MPFRSRHSQGGQDHGSFWTSYSDLFLGMSVIFLLLYVVTSLRTGTDGIRGEIENKRLVQRVEDLQNQLKAYDSIKKEYQAQASPSESKVYEELMDKLTLLKDETKDERAKLQNDLTETGKKEQALNQYQQMIRNVINSNLMAKTKIKTRENVIADQDNQIEEQTHEMTTLKSEIDSKTQQIAKDEQKMQDLNQTLAQKMADYKKAVHQHKLTQKEFEKKTQALKAQNQAQLSALQQRILAAQAEVDKNSAELNQTKQTLANTEAQNQGLQAQNQGLEGEKEALAGKAEALEGKARALAAEKAHLAGQNQELAGKAHNLEKTAKSLENQIGSVKAQADAKEKALGGQLAAMGGQLKDTEGLLAKARAEADARKAVARDIKSGFAKAGIDADVDERTGEVILNFGKVYFDVGSAQLKEQMKNVLQKALPVYSQSLLGNPKVSSKINSVEIIGFASPTYKGKMIDPTKLAADSRQAVNYNLDLSFARARSIFNYIFDEDQMHFSHQKDLLPLIKVTGRSFLAEKITNDRKPASGKASDFCSNHACKEAQRVIIRFNFEDKK